MNATRPPRRQPPEMAVIHERRTRPGISVRQAARLAGISEARWRQLEAGGRDMRGMWIDEEAPDRTLSRMAHAVGVTPRELRDAGRKEAAAMLEEYAAELEARAKADAEEAARMVGQVHRNLSPRQRARLEAEVADTLRRVTDSELTARFNQK
jgi:transcriptional regulator with XRE-family HTH domain